MTVSDLDSARPLVGFAEDEIDLSMTTREAPIKWVVVVDETLPAGRAANAAICAAAATMSVTRGIVGPTVADADGSAHPGLPWIGCTVLGANQDRLTRLRETAARQPGVAVADMPTQAQHTRVHEDYELAVSGCRSADLAYYAVSVVGPRKVVDKLTKGLSLLP
jgi:hypothetical protein